jgi:hypothetical protein
LLSRPIQDDDRFKNGPFFDAFEKTLFVDEMAAGVTARHRATLQGSVLFLVEVIPLVTYIGASRWAALALKIGS